MDISRSSIWHLAGALTAAGLLLPATAPGAEVTIWQLGTPGHSVEQFREAGQTMRFNLPEPPSGSYFLDLSVLLGYPRVPHLELDLNGTPGLIFLNRTLSYRAESRSDSPIYGEAHERIAISATLLRAGENELRITAVLDDAAERRANSPVVWDTLRLSHVATNASALDPEVIVEPTVFYTATNGDLRELVDVTVGLPAAVAHGEATLTLAGAKFRSDLIPGRFAQQRFEFAVPEFGAGADAEVLLDLNGRTLNRDFRITPKRKFTVYLVPNTHLDIGFTDYQPKIAELQNRNLDRLVAETRRDPEMRFSLDGAWLAEQYLRSRTPPAKREFLEQVAAGRITIPAQYANLMAGGASLETLIRSLTYGLALNRQNGVTVEYANITDVPSYPWAYASVLTAMGLKYFAAGANDDRGPMPLYGRWQTKSPFWWEGPDGGRILMAYTRQYSHLWFLCGLPPVEAACRDSLPTFLQPFDAPSYQPDMALMYGSQLENTDVILGEADFVRQWNKRYAWPQLKLATFPEYFHAVGEKYGDKLATVKGDWGPYWEDGIGTDALYAAMHRQNESRGVAVEKLASVASLLDGEWAPPVDRLRRMWADDVLYAEHTYTSSGGYSQPDSEQSVRQIESKHFLVSDAREAVYWIAQEAFSRLVSRIHVAAPALVVFNSLAHARSGLLEIDLPNGMELCALPGNAVVPVEMVRKGNGYDRVRFLAGDVPAMGYRVYELTHVERASADATRELAIANVIENDFYRVRVDPERGAVAIIFDKQLGRELLDASSPYLANQYVYVSGGEGSRIVYMRDSLPAAKLTVGAASGGSVRRVRKTAWGQVLTYTTSGPHALAIESDVMLFDAEKKIEFVNHLRKDPVDNKEAVYFSFPFSVTQPEFSYDGQIGIVSPARDELAGGCREWYTVRHWVRVAGKGASAALIPLDAPLVALGDINRGMWPQAFEPKSSTIFSYALNNYWHTNFPRVQSGDFTFRYVVTSGATLSEAALSRLGRESMTPLEVGQLTANDKVGNPDEPLPATPASFLIVDGANVELEAVKPAEDGNGLVLRLLETAGTPGDVRIRSPLLRFEGAWLCNAGEENQRELENTANGFEIPIKAFSILTVRVLPKLIAPHDSVRR